MIETITNALIPGMAGRAATIVIIISVLIQVAPIKVNPWSWIAKKVGRAMNGEYQDRIERRMDKYEAKLDKIEADMEEGNAKNNRTKILRFGDEILRYDKHSKDHFDEILVCITEYEQYCDSHPNFKNHITALTTKKILSTYEKCMEDNSFL